MAGVIEKIILEKELAEIEETLARTRETLVGTDASDKRENVEWELAKEEHTRLTNKKSEIELRLLTEDFKNPVGNSIELGRLLTVKFLGDSDNDETITNPVEEEEKLLLYGVSGDSFLKRVLSKASPLGDVIEGGREGIHIVSMGSRFMFYDVRIADSSREQEYLKHFSSSLEKRVDKLMSSMEMESF